jgi:UDP-N-acetylmuramyl tripeptide synthase
MKITQIVALRGPNRHSLTPVLEAILDTESQVGSSRVLANQITRAALIYQQRAGADVSFKAVMPGSYPGVYRIAIGYRNEAQARAALQLSLRVAAGGRVNLREEIEKLRQIPPGAVDLEAEQARNSGKLIIAVTGTNGKTTVVRLIAQIMIAAGQVTGWTSTEGSWVGRRQLDRGDNSGPQSARLVLHEPDVEVAVLETARGGILREGLAFDHADVAVVTNVSADHVGLRGVDTIDELARVKRVIMDAVKAGGAAVLNADNSYTVAMAAHIPPGARLIFFGLDQAAPPLAAHLAAGGAAAYREGERLMLVHDGTVEQITDLAHLPISMGGLAAYQVANALAAAAATWVVGVPLSTIATVLARFRTDLQQSGGRFNMFRLNGGLVILDYVHNQAAAQAVGPVIDALPARRRIVAPMSAGDRRDMDIMDYSAELGKHFDHFVLKEARHRRGRAPGELAALLERGVHRTDHLRPHVAEIIPNYDEANRHALSMVGPGDLLLISDDEFDQLVRQIEERGGVPLSEAEFQGLPSAPPATEQRNEALLVDGQQELPPAPPATRHRGRPPGRRAAEVDAAPPATSRRGRPPGRRPAEKVEAPLPPPEEDRAMEIGEAVALAAPNRHGNIAVLEARLDSGRSGLRGERLAWDVATKAIVFQQLTGAAVSFKSLLPTDRDGVYLIGVAYHNEAQARAALELAGRVVAGAQVDFDAEIKKLHEMN